MTMHESPASSTASRWRSGRRRYARPALITLGVMLLAGFAVSPSTGRPVVGKIRGTVLDASSHPLSGLMVQLSSQEDDGILRVTGTDERGRYLFRDLPAGIYEIVVGANGYERAMKIGIEVRPPFQNIVGFALKRSAEESGEGTLPGAGVLRDAGSAVDGVVPPGLVSTIDPNAVTMPVRGLFLDKDRNGIPEVSVTFIGVGNGGAYQNLSGEDGTFLLDAVPIGLYRVLVSSPGHVALDLPSVEVAGPGGLNLSLSLVDYPLNSRERLGVVPLPEEKARPLPAAFRFIEGKRSENGPGHAAGTGDEHEGRNTKEASGEQSVDGRTEPDDPSGSDEDSGSD
ncbi:MAG: carboxypeptidase-like regulatory domain-containing protein [Acidobacteria bacterium]|nr:carboxypeptidase-like regulatory domain-containing protein [Acidobacteriota bacterium]